MPRKPYTYLSVHFTGRTELDRLRFTDACVQDTVRELKETAALATVRHADLLMARDAT